MAKHVFSSLSRQNPLFTLVLSSFCLCFLALLDSPEPTAVSGSRLVSGHGLEGPGSLGETMRIHMENQAKLQAMSRSEILQEQKKLLSQLGRH